VNDNVLEKEENPKKKKMRKKREKREIGVNGERKRRGHGITSGLVVFASLK